MSTHTPTSAPLCPCGKPATPENVELYHAFPAYWRPICGACEAKRTEDEIRRKEEIDARRRQLEREARLDVIPPEMRRTTPSHPGFNPSLWLRVQGWKPSDMKWLGIVGIAGQSKTRSLSLLARDLILDGHRVKWTTATEFQDRVDDLRGEPSERKEALQYMKEAKAAAILVFDDLGKNTWTPALERHLFALVDHRKTHDLPILWTANTPLLEILASGQLTKDRGAPLIGRLLEASKIITA